MLDALCPERKLFIDQGQVDADPFGPTIPRQIRKLPTFICLQVKMLCPGL